MPNANVGDVLAFDRKGGFISLKNKDEKYLIRFTRMDYSYDGKHFSQGADGKWTITDCDRINKDIPCDICDKAFEIKRKLKGVTDENEKKKIHEEARPYEPKITFYYPVLDRGDETCKILKTTLSIRLKIEEQIKDGKDILTGDYTIKRTEKPGSEYYTLVREDSADTKPLTEREIREVAGAKTWNLEQMIGGKKSEFEPEIEDVVEDDELDKLFNGNNEK